MLLTPVLCLPTVVVETRSFDHMLGPLAEKNPEIDGCPPSNTSPVCSNPIDPSNMCVWLALRADHGPAAVVACTVH